MFLAKPKQEMQASTILIYNSQGFDSSGQALKLGTFQVSCQLVSIEEHKEVYTYCTQH